MADIEFFQLTDPGSIRAVVGHWPREEGVVFAIADGLGVPADDEVAGVLAMEILAAEMARAPGSWALDKRLRRAFQEVNLRLYHMAITVPELRGMGTALTASAVVGSTLVAAHVGDCRLFLLRDGVAKQLSKDHTWAAEQVQSGLLSPERANAYPRQRVVTRALGRELITAIDVLRCELRRGDVLAQMADGIHGVLAEAEIVELLNAHPPEPGCRALVRRAREEGGEDLSVQVAAVVDCPAPAGRAWWKRLTPLSFRA